MIPTMMGALMTCSLPMDARGQALTPRCASTDVAGAAMEYGAATVSTSRPGQSPAAPASNGLLQERACVGPVAVIGDIHGRLDLLDALLMKLDGMHAGGRMPVCVVGDLIDRGDDSAGVIERLISRKAFGVRGNHEAWFLQCLSGEGFDRAALGNMVGGAATLASYCIERGSTREIEGARFRVPVAHRQFVASLGLGLRLVVDGQTFYVVHAGVSPADVDGADAAALERLLIRAPDTVLWPRRTVEGMAHLDGVLITGHTPGTSVMRAPHAMCIDTGAGVFEGGALTAVILPTLETITVP
jgi:serine/threonine protein phosphatase 1